MQIELEKLSIDCACMKCGKVETQVSIEEIFETGTPMCINCEEEMEAVCAHLELMEGVSG